MVSHNSYCPPARRSCMTHRQAKQDFPDASQVSLHKSYGIDLAVAFTRGVPVYPDNLYTV
jgi:hypothetical protein